MKIIDFKVWMSSRIRRGQRHFQNWFCRNKFATEQYTTQLAHLVKSHRSPIYRNLTGVERSLFDGKKINLKIAISNLNGIVIPPNKIFSLWYLVGPPIAKRGFQDGLVICRGQPSRDTGGGLCQLSNAIFWLALHSDLKIVERHRHSLDIFPDDHRQIPFGTGATIVYNYKDIRLYNPTTDFYQLCFELSDTEMISSLRISRSPIHNYRIIEENHKFEDRPEGLFRCNTIVREKIENVEEIVLREVLFHNDCRCQYSFREVKI